MNTKLNKSDWILLAVVYGTSMILNGLDYYRDKNTLLEFIVDLPLSTLIAIIVILILIKKLIPELLVRKKSYIKFLLFGVLTLTFFGSLDNLIGFMTAQKSWDKFQPILIFLQNGLYNCSDMIGLPLGILLIKKFYEGQTEYLKVEKQQKENELKLLRSQIDPHFLFNNLNTLDSLIDSDSEKAKEYINRLSLIYRYLIKTKDAEVMELSEELNLAENYMFLIKTRFGDDYNFNIFKNVSIDEKFIPTGALQTLLENVVKHNKPEKNTTVSAQIFVEDDYIKVVNSKSNISSKTESFGTGINNLKMRYKLLSNKEIVIINTDEQFTISIPIIKLVD